MLPQTRKNLFFPLVLSLFILSSCKENELELPGNGRNNAINTFYTDTLTLEVSTVSTFDSIITSQSNILLVGAYQDAYGIMRHKAYSEVRLTEENKNLSSFTPDSVRLELKYAYAYGDTNSTQTLDVFKVNNSGIGFDLTYYTHSAPPSYEATALGSLSFQARPVSVGRLRIPISDTYGQELMNASNGDQANFVSIIRGLAILPSGDNGSSVRISISDPETRVIVYYKDGAETKTAIYSINTNCARYYTAESDLSGTLFASIDAKGDELSVESSGDLALTQCGTGLKVRVRIPYLSKLITENPDAVVLLNKAELVMPVYNGNEGKPAAPTFSLLRGDGPNVIKKDEVGVAWFVQGDGVSPLFNSSAAFSNYNETSQEYRIYFTSYMQGLLRKEVNDDGFFITPLYNVGQAERIVLKGPNGGMKLRLYFTKGV